jgi:CBS domain-containing protein
MILSSICTLDPVCCQRTTTAREAAALMREHHLGDLVVVDDPDDDRLVVGVITDRDLAVDVMAQGLDPNKTVVGSLMRTPVVLARVSEEISVAIERMQAHGVRRLPIVDDHEKVVGVITLDDLLALNASNAAAISEIVNRGRRDAIRRHR